MRRSLIQLVVVSVLACWAVGLVFLVLYGRSQTWSEERIRKDGVFLVHEILERTPQSDRRNRLREIQQHFSVPFSLISHEALTARTGQIGSPESFSYRQSVRKFWYYIVLEDGSGVLAAGPVNPSIPAGVVPVGLILLLILLPVLAATVTFRLGRSILKVERANQALGVGDLSVRVNDEVGSPVRLGESFNAMADRVEHLIQRRDELVQAVSHELGSPFPDSVFM